MGIVLRVAAAALQLGGTGAHAALQHCRAQNLLAAAAAVSTQITAAFCIVAAGVPRLVELSTELREVS